MIKLSLLWLIVLVSVVSYATQSYANTVSQDSNGICLSGWQTLASTHTADSTSESPLSQLPESPDSAWESINPLDLGKLNQNVWLRTRITYVATVDDTVYLTIDNPTINRLDVYWLIEDQLVNVYESGRRLPFKERPIDHRQFIFPLKLSAQSTGMLYLHVQSLGPIAFKGCIETEDSISGFLIIDALLYGIAFGLMALVFIYALMTYYFERSPSYAFFALAALFGLINQVGQTGFGYQLLWPDSPFWNQISGIFFVPLLFCALIFFTIHFLELKQRMPGTCRLLYVLAGLFILYYPLMFLAVFELIPLEVLLSIIPIVLLTFITRTLAGLYLWLKQKLKIARFFVAAQTITVTMASLHLLTRTGVLAPDVIEPWHMVYAGVLSLILLVVAITDRVKYIQNALTQAYDNLDRLIESMPSMVVLCDHTLRIVKVNGYLLNTLHYSKEELIGKPLNLLLSSSTNQTQLLKQLEQRESAHMEYDYKAKDQSDYPVLLSHTTFYQLDNPNPHRLCVAQSLLEVKKIEREREVIQKKLLQSQRLETIATTASGMAHDLKNIFTPIIGFSELLANDRSLTTSQQKMLNTILKASLQGSALIKQALAIGENKETEQLQPVSLYQIINEHLDLVRSLLPDTIELDTQLDVSPSTQIIADKNQLVQVLMNVCQNAQHAMEDKKEGTLTIALTELSLGENTDNQFTSLPLGDYVCLMVKDTGCGIDATLKDKIFEPFYTSKESGKGTGLGLSIVYNAVYRASGHIHVESEKDQGTTFSFLFPIHKAEPLTETQTLTDTPSDQPHILYVDDDAAINFLMQHSLSKYGYRVTTTQQSMQALDYMRANPDQYDLVISDHSMPDMSGLDLIREIKTLKPEIPALFVTGQEFLLTRTEMDALGVWAHLSKPVLINDLVRMIRQALATNQDLSV